MSPRMWSWTATSLSKRSARSALSTPHSRERFLLEAEITGGLEHPGIVPVYALGVDAAGCPYYAMRFVKGVTLYDAINGYHRAPSGPGSSSSRVLELQKLLRRFLDVCNALAYAHSRGVLHRDIKPANIMVGQFGETVVLDWGLAKVIGTPDWSAEATLRPRSATASGETLPGAVFGTPAFMSPEQADGLLDRLGPATDVYSLGATLYSLLTGKVPVDDKDMIAARDKVRRGAIPRPREVNPAVPRALEAICLMAMAVKPEHRYPTPRALADDLERWLADEPISAWREPFFERAGRWARNHRTAVTAAALAGVVALSALAIAYRREAAVNERLRIAQQESYRRLDQTLQAVKDYYAGVGEEVLLGEEEFKELRARLLEKPRRFYEELTRDLATSSDENAMSLLAKGHSGYADVLYSLGLFQEAKQQYANAQRICQTLASSRPAAQEYRRLLAECYSKLGTDLDSLEDYDGAKKAYREAIDSLTSLAASVPPVIEYQRALALNLTRLGNTFTHLGDFQSAAQMQRQAQSLFEKLAKEYPDNQKTQEDLASSYVNLAVAGRDREDLQTTLATYVKAREIFTRLLERQPDSHQCREGLAACLTNLGRVQEAMNDRAGAIATHQSAIATWLKLVKAQPNVPRYQERLAVCYGYLGDILISMQSLTMAGDAYKLAVEFGRKLVEARPGTPVYREDLAQSLDALGRGRCAAGDHKGAIVCYLEAIELDRKLAEFRPDAAKYQAQLATSYNNLAVEQCEIGEARKAEGVVRQAIEIAAKLVKAKPGARVATAEPKSASNWSLLGCSYGSLAEALEAQGRQAEAEAANRKAIELQRAAFDLDPDNGQRRFLLISHYQGLARTLRAQGRAAEAADVIRRRVSLFKANPRQLYEAATEIASCVDLAASPVLKQTLSAEAVAVLRAAFSSGIVNAAKPSRDPALAPLRDREDFRALIGEVFDRSFPADPFASR